MATHDNQMTESNDEGVERTKNEHYAFFMESTTIEYVVERQCSLASVGQPLDDKGYAIAMKKSTLVLIKDVFVIDWLQIRRTGMT